MKIRFSLIALACLVAACAQTSRPEAFLQEVSYIITAPEKAAFTGLQSDPERDRFIEQFWEQRNPTPGSVSNDFRDEYYRRLNYANVHFAGDRVRIYVLDGPPDEIESHSETPSAPPNEAWHYHHLEGVGDNVDFVFVDFARTGDYRLSGQPSPAKEAMPAATGATQRIRVGSGTQAANLVTKVDPIYPPLALQARIQGAVRFSVTIGKDGRPANIQLVSGHPLLVKAAKEALQQWIYKPTLLNGEPAEVLTQAEVYFTLPPKE
jgi:TonB family protein